MKKCAHRDYVGFGINHRPKRDFKDLELGDKVEAIREVMELTMEFNNERWRNDNYFNIQSLLEKFLFAREHVESKLHYLKALEAACKTEDESLVDFVLDKSTVAITDCYKLMDEEHAKHHRLNRIQKDILILEYIKGIEEQDARKLMEDLGYKKEKAQRNR
jgi:hypothetical protein